MTDEKPDDDSPLEPVEPCNLLKHLSLTTGKAAQFAGVSRRQLCYWTDTGIVAASNDDTGDDEDDGLRRTYDFDGLNRVLLIKQTMKRVPGLRRAAKEVDQYLAGKQRQAEELTASIGQQRDEFLTEQAERLEMLSSRVRELLTKVKGREELLDLTEGMEWLNLLGGRILEGEVLLEEDAEACLRLANLIEQAEAKVAGLSPEQ